MLPLSQPVFVFLFRTLGGPTSCTGASFNSGIQVRSLALDDERSNELFFATGCSALMPYPLSVSTGQVGGLPY